MFLLNSRTTLVTAPWTRTYTDTSSGIPSTEGTGPICRIPWARLDSHILGFSPRGTSAGSGYGCFWFFFVPFSRTPEINSTDHRPAHQQCNPVLIITILPGFVRFDLSDEIGEPIQKRQKQSLCCHAYKNNSGILTAFPFLSDHYGES